MERTEEKGIWQHLFGTVVIVAALGYFVDIYDLLLFGIVRIPSLVDLGLDENAQSIQGASILNWQMSGLLLGGILWGILGDKKGRLSVLFGSIVTYSIANFACGFVQDVTVYKALRFIAGIGLAGELGAGITLVSESLPKKLRGIGASVVAGVGLLGAVAAYFTVELFSWRYAYFTGGGLGVLLLFLRVGVFESGMFTQISDKAQIRKGSFMLFFTNPRRLKLYAKCIGIGLPTWYVIGILATFSNEFAKAMGVTEPVKPGLAVMWCYIGLAVGDLLSGVLSYLLASRKKAVTILMVFTLIGTIVYLYAGIENPTGIYLMCLWLGFGIGYWAMFVTIGAEQFGTNLRATAATTIPNMVRGTVVLMTTFYAWLKPDLLALHSAAIIGVICFGIGIYCILTIPETHDRELNFIEQD
ncbi:putative sialic acid transporter [compost metagenome]|uniref:MFS transporter n=1 Tax=Pedobacter ghigonis TaxID=2730403 RepID=UPI000FB656E6|nr:MFS transporter [Pedobacter ghigonis]